MEKQFTANNSFFEYDGKEYRNLPSQVQKNKDDIEEIRKAHFITNIVQKPGQSTTDVMSQKATTDELDKLTMITETLTQDVDDNYADIQDLQKTAPAGGKAGQVLTNSGSAQTPNEWKDPARGPAIFDCSTDILPDTTRIEVINITLPTGEKLDFGDILIGPNNGRLEINAIGQDSVRGEYIGGILPIATEAKAGVVAPVARGQFDNVPVSVDEAGKLWTNDRLPEGRQNGDQLVFENDAVRWKPQIKVLDNYDTASRTEPMSQRATIELHNNLQQQINNGNRVINQQNRRITNLEQGLPADRFIVDEGVAYTKDIPANVCDYGTMVSWGGMSRRSTNLFDISKVSGSNLAVSDNTITVSGSQGYCGHWLATLCPHLEVGKTYYIKAKNDGGDPWIYLVQAKLAWGFNGEARTMTEEILHSDVVFYGPSTISDIAIVESLDTPYEPYYEDLRSAPVVSIDMKSANLCSVNEITFTQNKIFGMDPIPAGTYNWSFFFDCPPNSSGVCLCELLGGPISKPHRIGNQKWVSYGKTVNLSITVDEPITGLNFYAGSNWNDAKGKTATLKENIISKEKVPFVPFGGGLFYKVSPEILNLSGYGVGTTDYSNTVDWENKTYTENCTVLSLEGLPFQPNNPYPDKNIYIPRDKLPIQLKTGIVVPATHTSIGGDLRRVDTDSRGNFTMRFSTPHTEAEFTEFLKGAKAVFPVREPITTNIKDMFYPAINISKVFPGGTMTFTNPNEIEVPSKQIYQKRGNDIL